MKKQKILSHKKLVRLIKEEKPNPDIKAPKYSIGIYTNYKKTK